MSVPKARAPRSWTILAIVQVLILVASLMPAAVIAQDAADPAPSPAAEASAQLQAEQPPAEQPPAEQPAAEPAPAADPAPQAEPDKEPKADKEPKPDKAPAEEAPAAAQEPAPVQEAAPAEPELKLFIYSEPKKLDLTVGDTAKLSAWLCPPGDGHFGADEEPATADDTCAPAQDAAWSVEPASAAALGKDEGVKVRLSADSAVDDAKVIVELGDLKDNAKLSIKAAPAPEPVVVEEPKAEEKAEPKAEEKAEPGSPKQDEPAPVVEEPKPEQGQGPKAEEKADPAPKQDEPAPVVEETKPDKEPQGPKTDEPAPEAVTETPAEPVLETPAEPVVETPVSETPAEPLVEVPAPAVVETPAEEQPAPEAAVADGPTDAFIVTFTPGTDNGKKLGLIKDAGAKAGKTLGDGSMQLVEVPRENQGKALGQLKNDPSVGVDPNYARLVNTVPDDPGYLDQWALPMIGWDEVFGSVDPAGRPSSPSSTPAWTPPIRTSPASSTTRARRRHGSRGRGTPTATAPGWPASSRPR